jgi:tetratricopeptide (TPR) repeat protein
MVDGPADGMRGRYAALVTRLDAADASTDRNALKADIIELFRAVERELAELGALKEDVKKLAERWKSIGGATQPTAAPHPVAPPLRADHIGASTFIEKGWSRISLGDYPAAETALTKALELSPNDLQAVSLLGWAQMHQEKYDDALMNFQRVLMKEPANALARINVGYICLKKRIFGEAIEHLSKAIRLDNDAKATLYAHYYLGLVYLEREMYEDAQTFFRKSLALGPNLLEASYELGRAQWLADQRDDAKETWRAGAAANKFNPWGKRCAEVLAKVEAGGEPFSGIGNRKSVLGSARGCPFSLFPIPDSPGCWLGSPCCLRSTRRAHRRPPPDSIEAASPSSPIRLTSSWPSRSSPPPRRTTPSPGCRARNSTSSSRSPPIASAFANGPDRARRSGVPRSRSPNRTASLCRDDPRRPTQVTPWRSCVTSSRTSPYTRTWASSRRAGSTKATRATPRMKWRAMRSSERISRCYSAGCHRSTRSTRVSRVGRCAPRVPTRSRIVPWPSLRRETPSAA